MNMNYIFLFLCFPLISSISLNAMLQEIKKSQKRDYEALASIAARRQKPLEFSYFSQPPQFYLACPHKKIVKNPSGFYYQRQSMEKKPPFFIGQNSLPTPRK